jgi:hypothetical protein
MQAHRHYSEKDGGYFKRQAEFPTIQDLLFKQSKGKIQLTREEKARICKYAEETRKERLNK